MSAKYQTTLEALRTLQSDEVLGKLARGVASEGYAATQNEQLKAWPRQLASLKTTAERLQELGADLGQWAALLEYTIPGIERRIDTVVLYKGIVFVVEFKTGKKGDLIGAVRQVEDYALDLADFHGESARVVLVPIVVTWGVHESTVVPYVSAGERVQSTIVTGPTGLGDVLFAIGKKAVGDVIAPEVWSRAQFRPVPTILQAATALYAGHEVREIADAGAGAENLTKTADAIVEAVHFAEQAKRKVICFVTGVPGAGKTLAGLNAVHSPELRKREETSGMFLSGNGPLVKILREALARDKARRAERKKGALRAARQDTESFVANVHTFIRTYSDPERENRAPIQRLIVFDEAQRAWNAEKQLEKFDRDESEPETLLSIVDRHRDWAVIVCLVGGGQEIHDGEAGLQEWGRALTGRFSHWDVWTSELALNGGPGTGGQTLFEANNSIRKGLRVRPELHLPVSVRSYRSRTLGAWVDRLLSGHDRSTDSALTPVAQVPVKITRSLAEARNWLRSEARGHRRVGLVASSGAVRLRALGIEVTTAFTQAYRYEHWFLAPPEDVRSSYALEVAATEFQCQGLELDAVGVIWGDDLTWNPLTAAWRLRKWSGKRWTELHSLAERQYLINKYRVLLTRARTGTVVVVPEGDARDPTRVPEYLDATYSLLRDVGAQPL